MFSSDRNHTSTKFYQQDLVQRIAPPNPFGIILRCWHDAEDVPPTHSLPDPMMRQLQPGEVGVSFLNGGERDILPELDLRLIDRTIPPGDFCKRSIDDVRSGMVIDARVKGRLEHVISGEPVEGWKILEELESRVDAEIGDYVVYDDWIGQVMELFDESVIQVATGQLIRLPELSSRLVVGEKGTDILPPQSHGVYNLFGFLLGANRPGGVDTVVDVKHTVYAVVWLAVNQSLDLSEAEQKIRPQRFWYGEDIGKLTIVRSRSELEMRVGDRVRLKDITGVPTTRHSQEGDDSDVITVETFLVTETETTLDILWQDGLYETLRSTEVIPYLNPDEYDYWPGDHVVWKREDEKRPAIVQFVNASERTATVLLPDTGLVELVSVLELSPHGTSDLAVIPQSASEGLGVSRGDFVFIHREGSTNGYQKPSVPRIGELEAWIRECPIVDGQFVGWRKEISEIGGDIARRRESDGIKESQLSLPIPGSGCFSWFGEVTGLNLDGTVEVTHPDSTLRIYPLERLTKLYDGIEQIEDNAWGDDPLDPYALYAEDEDQIWSMNEHGVWQTDTNDSEWEEVDDDVTMEDDMGVDPIGWADEVVHCGLPSPSSALHDPAPHITPYAVSPLLRDAKVELAWKRFDILPCAPHDHAYLSSTPSQPSKAFLGRLRKEYRVLSSSLPDSIIVRAYEDRADLLRCLIIGPENTPYADAPFVIDWMLDSNFPQSPPIAHFHSWTNGNGRVNPNLYEDGKVCLSILGTWAGDRNETWSAARSSLLQALVSIQGLVLVKEPWFCEPAYDKLRGTEEGIVNSRLYNEKAYVLSRGFVRRALEIPSGGLESEINWLYHGQHRLEKVLQDAKVLIEKSKSKTAPDVTGAEELAVPRLTAGGILTLERILKQIIASQL